MVLGYLLEKAAMQKRYLSQSPFLGSMMIRLVCLHVQTASGLLFFSWRRSKECSGQMERFDAIG